MKLSELTKNVDMQSFCANADVEIHGVSYDSRVVRAGELFVAVSGYENDGHDYIEEAVSRGAVCIVCEKKPAVSIPYILVKSARRALALVSAMWFGEPSKKLKVIGVTGTNGKTTVTSLIKEILEKCAGVKAGLIGTNRNMIGERILPALNTTPESYELQKLLASMADEGCEYTVMEVSSHALYLDRVYGIEFEAGIYTNLSQDHLDFHDSMEEYASVKAQLFKCCRHAAINIDDEYAPVMLEATGASATTFSAKYNSADIIAKSIKLHENRVEFCALTIGNLQRIELNIPGMFSIYNALAAIAAAMLLGFDIERVSAVLQTCSGVKGRAEVVPSGRDFTILIDYAHTPDALENIITAVRGFAKGRIVTLFGCGGDRDPKKRPLMGETAARLSDFLVVTSDNPRTEEPGAIIEQIVGGIKGSKTSYRIIENRREAIFWALENSKPGDTLILAGKGHETYQIFGKEKTHFDEREIIAEYFAGGQR